MEEAAPTGSSTSSSSTTSTGVSIAVSSTISPHIEPSPPSSAPSTAVSAPTGVTDWRTVGTSVAGRPLRALTVGHGPRRVLWIGGIHGDEAEGALATSELPEAFRAAGLADAVTLTILEDANPDGRAAKTRFNRNQVDLNRNFPASNFDARNPEYGTSPLSQPESQAVKALIDEVDPHLVTVCHAFQGREFINFDGPGQELARRFSSLSGMPLEADVGYGTPGSMGSYVGRDRGIPILTIEWRRGSDPGTDWARTRAAALDAIKG